MKRAAVVLALACALVVGAPAAAGWAAVAGSAQQACGLPDTRPLWLDYAEGSVTFRGEAFGRSGIIAATSGGSVPSQLRASGAQTVYWWGKLGNFVGTTTKPADPEDIAEAADRLVDRAVTSSGCETPVIILNELNGPGTTTPWTPNNAQYRANVLALLRGIAARGARPLLLLPALPYTGGEALAWWRQAAEVADLVPEVYFKAPRIMRFGVVAGSRRMRQAYRNALGAFFSIGIPPSRLGLVIGFQSGPGTGGREGLQPSSAWLRFVKLQTLAAKQVASELKIGFVVSWGWGTFSQAGDDPDKPLAACVYLWARDPDLCDGVAAAGTDFNPSLDEGQIQLPAGARCMLDGRIIDRNAIGRLTSVTRDLDVSLTAIFARVIEAERAPITMEQVLEAELSIIERHFAGSRTAYTAALREAGASLTVGREVIGDVLRRAEIARRLTVPSPTEAQVAAFYAAFPSTPVRRVRVEPAPSWLEGRAQGFALFPPAPAHVLGLPSTIPAEVVTSDGSYRITPLDQSLPLGAVPLSLARPAIRAALTAFARADALDAWTVVAQEQALRRTTCTADRLPLVGSVDLSTYLPFLALDA
jgi:hypothetical protein